MKKAFIIIATATLLMTLLISNIALASDMSCPTDIKKGCAGETTTVTFTSSGWSNIDGAVKTSGWIGIFPTDFSEEILPDDVTCDPNTADPRICTATWNNLPAGDYVAVSAWWAIDEEDNIVATCPPGADTNFLDDPDLNTYNLKYFTIKECAEPEPEPEPCYCSLVVQKRDEAGHPINGAKFKVDGIEKKTVNGDARWDDLECGLAYEVRELSPNKYTERIRLEDECGKRSTLRIVNKEEEVVEVVEVVEEEVVIPEAGLDFSFTTLYAIAGLGILRILLSVKRKRK